MHLIYGILEKPVHSLQAINVSALHGGLQRVQLLKPNISIPQLPRDMKSMEITAPDVVIPSQETTYWCYMAELPEGFPKHHIIMVRGRRRGLLSPGWVSNCVHILQIACHREAFRPWHPNVDPKPLPGPAHRSVVSSCLLECLSRRGPGNVFPPGTSSRFQGRLRADSLQKEQTHSRILAHRRSIKPQETKEQG